MHLEALKLGMEPIARVRDRSASAALMSLGAGDFRHHRCVRCDLLRCDRHRSRSLGAAAPWVLAALLLAGFVYSVWVAAREPDLPDDIDIDNPVLPPTPGRRCKAGLHFLIPIGVLLWCLMVEELSPALSAFWAIVAQIVLMATAAAADRAVPRHARRRSADRGAG